MKRSRLQTTLLLSVVLACLTLAAGRGQPAAADSSGYLDHLTGDAAFGIVNAPNHPSDVLKNVTVVNLYWDTTWDADERDPSLSRTVLDYFTRSLISSGYFSGVAQYGAGPVRWGGGFLPAATCPAAPAAGSPVSLFDIGGFLGCQESSGKLPAIPTGGTLLFNVLLPQTVTADFAEVVPIPGLPSLDLDLGNCQGGNWGAYHAMFPLNLSTLGSVFTAIPTTPACADGSLDAVARNLSHEMVEALTDPFPPLYGWRHCFDHFLTAHTCYGGDDVDEWGHSLSSGEAADTCSDVGDFRTTPVPFAFTAPVKPFTFPATVAPYYSNADSGCVPTKPLRYSALPVPTVTQVSPGQGPCVGGATVTIMGTGFATASAVSYGNRPAASFGVSSDTSLTATAPPALACTALSTVDVVVTNATGPSVPAAADRFLYLPPCQSIGLQALVGGAPTMITASAGSVRLQATTPNCFVLDYQFLIGPPDPNCLWGPPAGETCVPHSTPAPLQDGPSAGVSWNVDQLPAGTYQVVVRGFPDPHDRSRFAQTTLYVELTGPPAYPGSGGGSHAGCTWNGQRYVNCLQ